ncbi:MAG TPA: protein arginine kinase [Phycisphaerae bacterium]|nr:protein arginine kinase [Phycisphaerae bacterium]HNU46818.1 protein arginine kinase [Phycisphaerae bacterium]
MKLGDFTRMTGEWLRGEGPLADVVVSTRVRLARNLAGYPFLTRASDSERTEIYRILSERIAACPFGRDAVLVDLEEADALDRELLVERHLISKQHAEGAGSRGVTISAGETMALMLNEEDHLRIQGLSCGMQVEEVWREADRIDSELGAHLDFAFDCQFGFLTACPTNVGTGIRVSVMLHLPALKLTQEIERILRAARDMHLAIRGLYGEGTEAAGDFFQISNQTSLGKTEAELARSFVDSIVPRIVEYERVARTALARTRGQQLDDKIWRAYGTLAQARMISTEETQALLSPLRMGICMDRFHELDLPRLNEIFLLTQPAHLQKVLDKSLDGQARAAARADFIRSRLES